MGALNLKTVLRCNWIILKLMRIAARVVTIYERSSFEGFDEEGRPVFKPRFIRLALNWQTYA